MICNNNTSRYAQLMRCCSLCGVRCSSCCCCTIHNIRLWSDLMDALAKPSRDNTMRGSRSTRQTRTTNLTAFRETENHYTISRASRPYTNRIWIFMGSHRAVLYYRLWSSLLFLYFPMLSHVERFFRLVFSRLDYNRFMDLGQSKWLKFFGKLLVSLVPSLKLWQEILCVINFQHLSEFVLLLLDYLI